MRSSSKARAGGCGVLDIVLMQGPLQISEQSGAGRWGGGGEVDAQRHGVTLPVYQLAFVVLAECLTQPL